MLPLPPDFFDPNPLPYSKTLMDFIYHPETLKFLGTDFDAAQRIVEEMRKMEFLLLSIPETDLDMIKVKQLVFLSCLTLTNPFSPSYRSDQQLRTELFDNRTVESRFVNEFISLQKYLKAPQDSTDLESKITHPALLAVLYDAEKK